ncbi:MAG: PEP-CTERM sorting domain-containing protein [Burkholderiaceae bacterium]
MSLKRMTFAACLGAAATLASAVEVPVDLAAWSKQGPAANGNWTVAPGGGSVTQSINGDPTFFVGPTSFVDTVLRGKIRVNGSGDDDFIGFVMGYNAPIGTGNDMDFVLLDWKQSNQNFGGVLASEGFALSRVNGTITNYLPGFWGHNDSAGFDNLATNFSGTLGWADNVEYSFEILYQSDRVRVDVTGGAFASATTVLDVAGSFPAGRFGFYNYSQANVTYSGFTLEELPPPVVAIPEPASYAMLALGLTAVGWAARRRRQPRG